MLRRIDNKARKKCSGRKCNYCDRIPIWRIVGTYDKLACYDHEDRLYKSDDDNDHMSEADYQTWGRL